MNPRTRAILQASALVGVVILLLAIFPGAFKFVELAAREIRYLWWIILLAALAAWLIWGLGRKR